MKRMHRIIWITNIVLCVLNLGTAFVASGLPGFTFGQVAAAFSCGVMNGVITLWMWPQKEKS